MFLGPHMKEVADELRRKHHQAFAVAEELNEYANWKVLDIEAKRTSQQQVLVATLLPRLLTAFQACVLVSERGLSAEATLLARKAIEVTFRIVAVAKSPDIADKYIRSDEVNRRDALAKLKALTTVTHTPEETETILRLHAETSERVKTEGIHAPTTRDFAVAAGLLDYYNTAYAYYSQSVHASVRDLEDTLEKDADGDAVAINYGPDFDSAGRTLTTVCESVLISLEAAFDLFHQERPIGLRLLRRKVETLFDEHKSET